jgi:hypothetical protein
MLSGGTSIQKNAEEVFHESGLFKSSVTTQIAFPGRAYQVQRNLSLYALEIF